MKKLLVIVLCFSIPVTANYAQVSADLQKLIEDAQKNNLDIRKQELAVLAAKDAIPDIWKFEDARLGVSGSYAYSESRSGAPGSSASPFTEELSLSVPVINQLSLSGKINDRFDSSIGLTLNPLDADTSVYKAEESYAKAVNQLASLRRDTAFSIEDAVLGWNAGQMNLSYLEASYELAGKKYDVMKKKYELGSATYDDLVTEEQSYIQARQKYYDGRNTALRSESSLYALLGVGADKSPVPVVSSDELSSMIAARDGLVTRYAGSNALTDKVKSLALELETLRKELGATIPVQPSIGLTANLGMPSVSFGASASISVSAKDFKFKDMDDLKANIAIKEADIAQATYAVSLDKEVLSRSIDIAREAFESGKKDLARAETDLKENDFLFGKGERTSIELELAKLNRESAEIRLYQSAASLYKAQADFLKLF